jgi:hypothetical protein
MVRRNTWFFFCVALSPALNQSQFEETCAPITHAAYLGNNDNFIYSFAISLGTFGGLGWI